jgi:hypothetical protein
MAIAKAVRPNTVADIVSSLGRQGKMANEGFGQAEPHLGMANAATAAILCDATDIVQIGRHQQHSHIGTLAGTNAPAQTHNAQRMLPVVAAPGIMKTVPGKGSNLEKEERLVAGVLRRRFPAGRLGKVFSDHGVIPFWQ